MGLVARFTGGGGDDLCGVSVLFCLCSYITCRDLYAATGVSPFLIVCLAFWAHLPGFIVCSSRGLSQCAGIFREQQLVSGRHVVRRFIPNGRIALTRLVTRPNRRLTGGVNIPSTNTVNVVALAPNRATVVTNSLTLGTTSIRVNFLSHFDNTLIVCNSINTMRRTLSRAIDNLNHLLGCALYRVAGDWCRTFVGQVTFINAIKTKGAALFGTLRKGCALTEGARTIRFGSGNSVSAPNRCFDRPH